MSEGRSRKPREGCWLGWRSRQVALSKAIGLNDEPHRLALMSDSPQPFLGLEVALGPVETQMSQMRLAEDRDSLARAIRGGGTPIRLNREPTSETELFIQRATEELMSSYEAGAEAQES